MENTAPVTVPTFVSAVTDATGAFVYATFNTAMANPSGDQTQFTVMDGPVAGTVTAADLDSGDSSNKTIGLVLTNPVWNNKVVVTLAYTEGSVKSADGGALTSFAAQNVTNDVSSTATSVAVYANNNVASVLTGDTLQMIATELPTNSNQSVTWSVTNSGGANATISSSGLLTAGSNTGNVKVKAVATDGSGKSATKKITIGAAPVSSITVTGAGGASSVNAGKTLQMSATVSPTSATDKSVVWSVYNTSGADTTISSKGLLTAGSTAGTATVTATAVDGSGTSGTDAITVNSVLVSSINVTGLDNVTKAVYGDTLQMIATVLPDNASNKSVVWAVYSGTGKNAGTASIDSDSGLLTGTATGAVTVRATAADGSGKTGTKTIVVVATGEVTGISVSAARSATTVLTGKTLKMTATVSPTNAADKTVSWSVYNSGGADATISSKGLLTAGSTAGTATVTATANDGSGIYGTEAIAITAIPVTKIAVTAAGKATSVLTGYKLQMSAAVKPANATDNTVAWAVSSGTGTATIDSSGLLIGTSAGTVTVQATANDGSGISGSDTITVKQAVTSVTVTSAGVAAYVYTGKTLQMTAAVLPSNATNNAVIWSVRNTGGSAAGISSKGLLTASKTAGTVTITATAKDNSSVYGSVSIAVYICPVFVTSITVVGTDNATSVVAGSTLQMSTTVKPANAADASVSWAVYNGTGTATINSSGLLTGDTAGSVTVKAFATDGSGKSGSKKITVKEAVSSITVTGASSATSVKIGGTLQMTATVSPTNAYKKAVTWSVTNSGGANATISSNGLLTAGSTAGSVTVTVTATDGSGVLGSTTITVSS